MKLNYENTKWKQSLVKREKKPKEIMNKKRERENKQEINIESVARNENEKERYQNWEEVEWGNGVRNWNQKVECRESNWWKKNRVESGDK